MRRLREYVNMQMRRLRECANELRHAHPSMGATTPVIACAAEQEKNKLRADEEQTKSGLKAQKNLAQGRALERSGKAAP